MNGIQAKATGTNGIYSKLMEGNKSFPITLAHYLSYEIKNSQVLMKAQETTNEKTEHTHW